MICPRVEKEILSFYFLPKYSVHSPYNDIFLNCMYRCLPSGPCNFFLYGLSPRRKSEIRVQSFDSQQLGTASEEVPIHPRFFVCLNVDSRNQKSCN